MCGISGIIKQNGAPVSEEEIRSINDLIIHRGPDAEGYFFGENFAFGHRRLSIIDLSEAGNQPMSYLDRYTITYNGEIYNYLELRHELSSLDYEFRSQSDTEVILAAFDCWGEECVEHFNGMWAFALYDQQRQSIFCSRDRFGIKPLYYTEIDGRFVVCSEIKQALEFHPENIVNVDVLVDHLVLGLSEHTAETFFDRVYSLRGGHNLIYDLSSHTYDINCFYQLKPDDMLAHADATVAVKKYRALLQDSVKLRLRSDVKVGTCLSGGLDSSAIAAIAADQNRGKSDQCFTAVTASSTNPKNDESHYAEKVVNNSGLDWNVTQPSSANFIDITEELVRIQEEPFGGPSLVMQYFVFREANRVGCKVMLDGQGGDETLLGYERYYAAYVRSLPFPQSVFAVINSSKNSRLKFGETLSYLLYFWFSGVRKYYLTRRNAYLKKKYLGRVRWEWLDRLSIANRNIMDLQLLELGLTQLPHLLRYEDRNSMAHSVESRLPYLDYRLVELAISLPNEFKIRQGWTKFLLRKSAEPFLPTDVVWRKNKFGFEAPADDWLRKNEELIKTTINESELVKEIATATDTLSDTSRWALFYVAVWGKVYDVKIRRQRVH